MTIPPNLHNFITTVKWTYAKTMPKWPHEYIVRDQVNEELFEELIHHIRANGSEGKFYSNEYIYLEENGLVYWTMGAPVSETIIINRCKKEDTYEYRLKTGTLPK
jgi:hypothetical protein